MERQTPPIKKEPVEEATETECSAQDKPYASMEAKLVCLGLNKGENKITLKVKGQDGEELYYKMPKNKKLGFLMRDYCCRMGFAFETIRFLNDTSRVREYHTPQELKMEDDDIIEAFFEQIGG